MSAEHDTRATGTPGQSVQTYLQLSTSWMDRPLEVLQGTKEAPEVLLRVSMGRRSVWRRISGRGSGAVFRMDKGEG